MELPHIGEHCCVSTCKRLDFLPMKCDACSKIFCGDHITYSSHCCTESYKKDNQVPVCPLCNKPCPPGRGELADAVVSRHIESDCLSDPAKERRKVYTNRCSKKGCKVKELIPVQCETCRQNFCLRHRHEQDHQCQGFQNSGRAVSNAGAAALFRFQKSQPVKSSSSTTASTSQSHTGSYRNTNSNNSPRPRVSNPAAISSLQGSLNEDEALALALQQSMGGNTEELTQGMTSQEREDFLLAQALSMSEAENRPMAASRSPSQTVPNRTDKSSCEVQ